MSRNKGNYSFDQSYLTSRIIQDLNYWSNIRKKWDNPILKFSSPNKIKTRNLYPLRKKNTSFHMKLNLPIINTQKETKTNSRYINIKEPLMTKYKIKKEAMLTNRTNISIPKIVFSDFTITKAYAQIAEIKSKSNYQLKKKGFSLEPCIISIKKPVTVINDKETISDTLPKDRRNCSEYNFSGLLNSSKVNTTLMNIGSNNTFDTKEISKKDNDTVNLNKSLEMIKKKVKRIVVLQKKAKHKCD